MRRFLRVIPITIVLGLVFFAEQNWHGAYVWDHMKAKWEASGESFDATKFIPPSVPDEQNLAALPVFALENDLSTNTRMPVKLKAALSSKDHGGDMPALNKPIEGIRGAVAAAYERKFPDKETPADLMSQFEALYPIVPEVLAAAKTRPLFRLNGDYGQSVPMFRNLEVVTDQIPLARLIGIHALLALNSSQTSIALDDIKVNVRIAQGAGRDPSLVGGLVEIGIIAITRTVIDAGIVGHLWSDAQLADIQETLGKVDLLAQFQATLRAEVACETVPNITYFATMTADGKGNKFAGLWPSGWMGITKARVVDSLFGNLTGVDLKSRRVFPEVGAEIQHEYDTLAAQNTKFLPWNMMSLIFFPPVQRTATQFGQQQALIDMDRIACGLERYRLAHGAYPEKLEELVPACIADVPRDVMSGEAYHYQMQSKETFLLYSVGGNHRDDAGKAVYKFSGATQPDLIEGDWVWPATAIGKK